MDDNVNNTLNKFLDKTFVKNTTPDGKEEEVCDLLTGECYIMRTRDGIIERINKNYITEDGRLLLGD